MWEDKETTAPIPSVAPDGEQPSAFARTVSITEIEETRKQFGKIQIMTMPELMETRFRVRPAVIDGLLPVGTYLLAGAPKIGKSFLVLQMAYQVSMGAPFLGFSSRQGTVLYLALEDTCERLQKRLAQMTEQDSEHLILSVFSETLDEGLTERLSDFWSEHTDTVLIIIDTLQRVRSRTPDGGSYAADYDTLARLKEFSDTFGVTVLIVHHTRKEGTEDVFNMISGTNGLMGAADGALLLHKDKRTASDAVLEVVGRDQPQLRLHLRFNVYWYDENGEIIAAGMCAQWKNDSEFMLKSFSQYNPGQKGETQTTDSGNSSDTGPGSGSSLREDYDDPEDLYEDGDYEDLDEAWDEWEEGW